MSLQVQIWPVVPAGNGNEYTGYPLGNPPAPTFSQIPNFLGVNPGFSVNIRSLYLTPSSGPTLNVSSLPSGWAFDGTTLTASSTGAGSIFFTASQNGLSSNSNPVSIQSVSSLGADTAPPSVPLAIKLVLHQPAKVIISGDSPSDPSISGYTWNGLNANALNVLRTPPGTVIATVPKTSGTDNQPIFTLNDIGAPSPPSTFAQSNSTGDITVVTSGDNIFGTSDQFAFAAQQITGTSWVLECRIDSFVSTQVFAKAELMFRTSLDPASAYVAALTFPFAGGEGCNMEYRTSFGASASQKTLQANSASPVYLFLYRSGDTYTAYYSLDGNNQVLLGSVTQVMGSTGFAGFALSSNQAGLSVTCVVRQLNLQTLPGWTYEDDTVGTGSYTYQFAAQDAAGTPDVSAYSSALTVAATGGGAFNPLFPRKSSYRIGGSYGNAYAPTWQAWAIAFDMNVINGHSSTFVSSAGRTRDAIVSGASDGSNICLQYILGDCVNSTETEVVNYATTQGWKLAINGTAAPYLQNFYNGSDCFNWTPAVPSDSNGLKFYDYYCNWCDQQYRTGGTTNATTKLAGFHLDNLQRYNPSGNADFDRNGSTDSATTSPYPLQWRTGEARGINKLLANNPTMVIVGNLQGALNGDGSHSFTDATNYNPITGTINGGMYETAFGFPYSDFISAGIGTAGLQRFLSEYRFRLLIAGSRTPNIVTVQAQYLTSTGQLPITWNASNVPTGYGPAQKGMRFALCMTLLDIGYWCYAPDQSYDQASGLYLFDEGGGKISQYPKGFLGAMTTAPPTAASMTGSGKGTYGVWRNDFANGIVLVNPYGNGTVTIGQTNLGGGNFYRLRGVDDPTFNNAQLVTDASPVTLTSTTGHGDGCILMRAPQ